MLRKLFGKGSASRVGAPVDYWWTSTPDLSSDGYQEVVGESHYQDALAAAVDALGRAQLAVMVRDRGNRHDRNAVAVRLCGRTVGYVPAEAAVDWHRVLDELGGSATVRATVTGGEQDYDRYGVVLHALPQRFDVRRGFLAGPARVLLITRKADVAAAVDAVGDGRPVLLSVDRKGMVEVSAGSVPLGRMPATAGRNVAGIVARCAANGPEPVCWATVRSTNDGAQVVAVDVVKLNARWSPPVV